VALEFLKIYFPNKKAKVYIPSPSWPIHQSISDTVGFESAPYRYYDSKQKAFNIETTLEDLDQAERE
jgi:aspartate/tyrosine/aromatic aminotransferase